MIFFVKARAWQIMVIWFSPFLLFVELFEFNAFETDLERLAAANFFITVFIVMWIWSIGYIAMSLSKRRKRTIDKIFTLISISIILILAVYLWVDLKVFSDANMVMVTFYVNGYIKVALLFLAGYASKRLVEVEKSTRVDFPNYLGTFVLMVIFFIGVWFIQPRVNNLWEQSKKGKKEVRS